jgi:predicted ribosomally synthesized peptide with SipW-like signal peptide
MNRKIALSGLSIIAALTILGGATYAAFVDTANQNTNTFSVGDADLLIAPDTGSGPGTFTDSITGPTFNGLVPGGTKNFDFWLKNDSTSVIGLDLTADVSAINPAPDGAQTLDNVLLIKWNCDTDGDLSLGNNTPTAEFSPRAWFTGGNAGIGSLAPGAQMFCRMIGTLPSSADNSLFNQQVQFDVKYDASQGASPTPSPTTTPTGTPTPTPTPTEAPTSPSPSPTT